MTGNAYRAILILLACMSIPGVRFALAQSPSEDSGVSSNTVRTNSTNTQIPAAESKWTAGANNFRSPDEKSSRRTKESSGLSIARTWNAGAGNFGSRVQPDGIWRSTGGPSGGGVNSVTSSHPSVGARSSGTELSSSTRLSIPSGLGRSTRPITIHGSLGAHSGTSIRTASHGGYGHHAGLGTSRSTAFTHAHPPSATGKLGGGKQSQGELQDELGLGALSAQPGQGTSGSPATEGLGSGLDVSGRGKDSKGQRYDMPGEPQKKRTGPKY